LEFTRGVAPFRYSVETYPPYPLPLLREGGVWEERGLYPLSKISSLSPYEGERDKG